MDDIHNLPDEEWEEVLQVLRKEADDRGVPHSEFGAMLQILKESWGVVINPSMRKEFLK